jgi:glucose/arabinose dehydrogenase
VPSGAKVVSPRLRTLALVAVLAAALLYWRLSAPRFDLDRLRLPAGFSLDLFAEGLGDPRALAVGDEGTVFAGTLEAGQVLALPDRDRDGRADTVLVIARGLFMPHGVAFHNGALYVAELRRVIRYDGIEQRLDNPPDPVTVFDGLPNETHHGARPLRIGPDGAIYVGIGAPCNICLPSDSLFGTIVRIAAEESAPSLTIHARGVRNSEGFDWQPGSGTMWFTDNGRDWMGNDQPPEELNRLPAAGVHFGFPYCHGRSVADPEFGSRRRCADLQPPALELPAHYAPLGMRFYTGTMFPARYRGRAFIALHGSWNRSPPDGYRVVSVPIEGDSAGPPEVFVEGWLRGRRAWGRPVDVEMAKDGALLVSDDEAGVIYRISARRASTSP